ncbi:MAG: site-specific DNA-methyltransferase [Patescibacteria group bacterium]|jgi:adenine-specific DNA-methyltransferase
MSDKLNAQELLKEVEKLKQEIKTLKNRKKYGLVWEEKPEQVVSDCQNKLPILKEVKNKAIITDKNKPVNILMEGDNYHSLSVLNYTHKEKVDVIYIDPPYNTGNNDFSYNDAYVDSEDGFRHSKWLSFIQRRLKLAKNLLRKNGLIFISVNDIEQANLKIVCDEVFGEKNFLANLVWQNKEGGGSSDSKYFRIKHEYILVYGGVKDLCEIAGDNISNLERYKQTDCYVKTRGPFYLQKLGMGSIQYSKSLDYPITTPDGFSVTPKDNNNGKKACWRWSMTKFEWGLKNDFIVIKKDKTDVWQVYTKQYLNCDNEGSIINRTQRPFGVIDGFSSTQATKEQSGINMSKFTYPKPKDLISYLISRHINTSAIVVDFMAGSGTTGHAVLDLNRIDGGSRKFILCTNNENNICEDITYSRIKSVINGYNSLSGEKISGLGGNLKYYKTDFVSTEHINKISDESKIKLTYQAGEMIALRENTLEETEKNDWWQIFTDGKKQTAIYFKEDKTKLQSLVSKLTKTNNKAILYIFSWGKNEYKNEFSEYKNIRIEDIPEPILEVYKEINKL